MVSICRAAISRQDESTYHFCLSVYRPGINRGRSSEHFGRCTGYRKQDNLRMWRDELDKNTVDGRLRRLLRIVSIA